MFNLRCGAVQRELSCVWMRCGAACGQSLRTQRSMRTKFANAAQHADAYFVNRAISTSDLPFQRLTRYRSTKWPVLINLVVINQNQLVLARTVECAWFFRVFATNWCSKSKYVRFMVGASVITKILCFRLSFVEQLRNQTTNFCSRFTSKLSEHFDHFQVEWWLHYNDFSKYHPNQLNILYVALIKP